MNSKRKFLIINCSLIVVFIFIVLFFLIKTPVDSIKYRIKHETIIENDYGDLFFAGKVCERHFIKHFGVSRIAILCINLDSCNVTSFYKYDGYTALKIENGIATFPLGPCDEETEWGDFVNSTVYVSVNESNSHKMIFINENKDTMILPLYYTNMDSKEEDMRICDSCY